MYLQVILNWGGLGNTAEGSAAIWRSQLTGGMAQQEPCDIQQGQEEIPTFGWGEAFAVMQAGDCLAGGQLIGKHHQGLAGSELGVEPAVGPGSKGQQQHPWLYEQK